MSMAEIHAGMLAQERNRQNDRRERRDQFAAAFVTGMCAAPESEYRTTGESAATSSRQRSSRACARHRRASTR